MPDAKFIDFDRALAETDERPVVVHYQGRDWDLFSSLPAKPVVKLLRLMQEGQSSEDLGGQEMLGFMSELVPAPVLEAWLEGGMTLDHMALLLREILRVYQGGPAADGGTGSAGGDEAGEAEAPSAEPPTSSTGEPSKPTSPASIESTSSGSSAEA